MASLDKVQFSTESGFDLERAMELANLISVTYNEYEVWDTNKDLQSKESLPKVITGSKAFINLGTNSLERCAKDGKKTEKSQPNRDYERLNDFWHQQQAKVVSYERIDSFWFPQWWWGEVIKLKNIWEFFRTDIRNIFVKLQDLVVDEPIFGFIARSQIEPNKFFVVFRGTREAAEWFNNFRPVPKPFLVDGNFGNLGEVRNGFNLIYSSEPNRKSKYLTIQKTIQETIDKLFEDKQINNDSQIFVTGHSLGAGLATLAALHIHNLTKSKNIKPSIQLYTFASPRVGDENFAKHFNDIQSYRVINSEDLIQSIPLPTTEVVDDETFNGMNPLKKARFAAFKAFLDTITNGQAEKHYQHIGASVTFTKQTGKIAGNHNLTNTYREALNIPSNTVQ
jgi:Lipase (class 3)